LARESFLSLYNIYKTTKAQIGFNKKKNKDATYIQPKFSNKIRSMVVKYIFASPAIPH
jgi:hypothetical protein